MWTSDNLASLSSLQQFFTPNEQGRQPLVSVLLMPMLRTGNDQRTASFFVQNWGAIDHITGGDWHIVFPVSTLPDGIKTSDTLTRPRDTITTEFSESLLSQDARLMSADVASQMDIEQKDLPAIVFLSGKQNDQLIISLRGKNEEQLRDLFSDRLPRVINNARDKYGDEATFHKYCFSALKTETREARFFTYFWDITSKGNSLTGLLGSISSIFLPN